MGTVIRPQNHQIEDDSGESVSQETLVSAETIHQPLGRSLVIAEEPGEKEKEQSPTLTSGIFQQVSFSRFPKVIPSRLNFNSANNTRKKVVVGISGVMIGAVIAISLTILASQYRADSSPAAVVQEQNIAPIVQEESVVSVVMPELKDSQLDGEVEQGFSSVSEPEIVPSDIENFAKSTSPTIEARTFLATPLNSARRLEPGLAAPSKATVPLSESGAGKVQLRPVEGSTGRFINQRDGSTWQGGWSMSNPEHNIKLGSAYSGFISSGSGASPSSLRSFDRNSSDLIKGAGARGKILARPKSY